MGVTSIVDRELRINLRNTEIAGAFEPLDSNHDGIISPEDFPNALPKDANILQRLFWKYSDSYKAGLQRDVMHRAVANTFLYERMITERQWGGVVLFFDLYNDMIEADRIVNGWLQHNVDTWGYELEFDSPYFDENVRPYFQGASPSFVTDSESPFFRNGLNWRTHEVISRLSGFLPNKELTFEDDKERRLYCDVDAVPTLFKLGLIELVQTQTKIRENLNSGKNIQYIQVECDGDNCSPRADETEFDFFLLKLIYKDVRLWFSC